MAACPELVSVSSGDAASEDHLIAAIRVAKATRAFSVQDRRHFQPTFDSDGMPTHPRGVEHYVVKDYDRKEVSEFDSAPKEYSSNVRREIHMLVCTRDRKYSGVRRKLDSLGSKGGQTVLAIVSASVGQALGVAAGAISGLVAVALFAVLKVGVNAYCATVATPERK